MGISVQHSWPLRRPVFRFPFHPDMSDIPAPILTLQDLGDPSGHQDAAYWDQWFQFVGHHSTTSPGVEETAGDTTLTETSSSPRSHEWYCEAEELRRVLSYHLCHDGPDDAGTAIDETDTSAHIASTSTTNRIIHPGSGTSLVPLKFREWFSQYRQVVVDVSSVAIQEMKEVHEKQFINILSSSTPEPINTCTSKNGDGSVTSTEIEYLVVDLLQPLLPFENSAFDCWVDKGFVDAIFSDDQAPQREQAQILFSEIHRVLSDRGCLIIVSLAEAHSMQLILENWLQLYDNHPDPISKRAAASTISSVEQAAASSSSTSPSTTTGACRWDPHLHVWELQPITGNMRPFAFVLQKPSLTLGEQHQIAERGERHLVWHGAEAEPLYDHLETVTADRNVIRTIVRQRVQEAREAFKRSSYMLRSEENEFDLQRQHFLTLEVKPYDADADLELLSTRLRTTTWTREDAEGGNIVRILKPTWQPFADKEAGNVMPHQIVPIGFGISKLVLQCIVPSDDVDSLLISMAEWPGDSDFEGVQSVDVDWEASYPVADVRKLLGTVSRGPFPQC